MDDFNSAVRGGYRKRAFLVQYNVVLLFGAGAFAVAAASWVPLAVGGALELAWLVSAPWLSSFRRWVDGRRELATMLNVDPFPFRSAVISTSAPAASAPPPSSRRPASPGVEAPSMAPPGATPPSFMASPAARLAGSALSTPQLGYPASPPAVDAEYRDRIKRLGGSLREIRLLADEELRNVRSDELADALATLPELMSSFERLCKLHQRLTRFVTQTQKSDLEQELARLTESFSQERDLGLRVTLRQAVTLAQRRLEQHGRICSLQRASELRLDMVEGAASHVRSLGLTTPSPEDFATEIQSLRNHVASIGALEHDSAEPPASRRPGTVAPATPAAAGEG